jgi:hypothetical protein
VLLLIYGEFEFNGVGLDDGVDKTDAKLKFWLLLLD